MHQPYLCCDFTMSHSARGAQFPDYNRSRDLYTRGRNMTLDDTTMANNNHNRGYIKRDQSVDGYLNGSRPATQNNWGNNNPPDIKTNKDTDDILFDKKSGVTRITAQRQRRHSIQLGGTGNPVASSPLNNNNRGNDFFDNLRQDLRKPKPTGPPLTNYPKHTFDSGLPDGYASDTEILNSHKNRANMGVPVNERPRRPSLDLSAEDPSLRHGTAIFIRRPSISSLTLEKDSYVRDTDGRAYRKGDISDNYDSCVSDAEGDDYIKRNIRVRRHSISTPSGSYALRKREEPKLLSDFQDWGGYKKPEPPRQRPQYYDSDSEVGNVGRVIPVRRYSVTYAPSQDSSPDDVSPQQPVRTKNYLAAPDNAMTSSSSSRRTRRRRCRPLSIVKEDISPISVPDNDPDRAILNGYGNSHIMSRAPMDDVIQIASDRATINPMGRTGRRNSNTEISIKGENSNLNIKATGDVQISVNTSQPLAMAGTTTEGGNRVNRYAAWTPGMASQIPQYSQPSQITPVAPSPLGMWRQGNVLVDSVSPVVNGNAMPQNMYPWLPPNAYPVPVVVMPYPGAYNAHSGNPMMVGQNTPIHTPLSVDTGHTQPIMAATPQNVQPNGLLLTNGEIPNINGVQNQIQNVAVPTRDQDAASDTFSVMDNPPTPEPERCDIKDIIANFEKHKKTGSSSTAVPEFGATFKKNTPVVKEVPKVVAEEMCCQTEPVMNGEQDERYDLNVQKQDGWSVMSPEAEKEPTPLTAYIAEMSISEVKY